MPSRRGLFGWIAALAVAPAAFARKPIPYAIGGIIYPGPLPLVGEIPSETCWFPRVGVYADEVLAAMRTFENDPTAHGAHVWALNHPEEPDET